MSIGGWIFIENVHFASKAWISNIVEKLETLSEIHDDFRLFLSVELPPPSPSPRSPSPPSPSSSPITVIFGQSDSVRQILDLPEALLRNSFRIFSKLLPGE